MTDGLPMPRRLRAIVAVSLGAALVMIDTSIANVALPTIARDLGVQPSETVTIVGLYQLVLVMTLLPFAAVGERIGLRTTYQMGLAVFTVGSALCFFANSLPFLLTVRVVQALGASAVLSVSSAMVRSIYPQAMLGRGLGINTVVVTSAGALAPSVGGLVLAVAPWPWIFGLCVPFAVLSLLIGRRALPDPEPRKGPYDLAGAMLCAAAFGLFIGGLQSGVQGDSPVISAAIVVAGILLAVLFVRRQLNDTHPILPVDLLGQPVLALSAAGALMAFMATMNLMLWLPFHFQHAYGFSTEQTGALLAVWPVTMMFVAPTSGTLSDHIPAGLLGAVGMAVATVGLVLIALIPADPTMFDIIWRMVLCGVGFGFFFSPNTRLLIGSAPKDRMAAAGGLISTARLTGQALGATMAAALLAFGLDGYTPPLVSGGLAILCCLCSAARLRPAIRNPRKDEMVDLPDV